MSKIPQRIAKHTSCIKMQMANIMEIEIDINSKEKEMALLQESSDSKSNILDETLASIERKPEESKILFEKVCKEIQETSAMIKTLLEERLPLQRELDKTEDALNQYMWYGTILSKLSPSEWHKAQEEKTLKAEDAQKEQKSELETTTVSKIHTGVETGLVSCPERALSSIVDPMLPSCHSDTVVMEPDVERGCDENEEKLELYFSDPQQVMDLMMELTDQVLSLIHNSTEVDKVLEDTIEITINKMKDDEEKLTMQENYIKERIKGEEKRTAMMKMMVQLKDSLKTEDHDILLAALGKKVREVYSSCADSNLTNLSTLEKLCRVEHRMTVLLQQVENIPEEIAQPMWCVKDNERKSRLREEKLKLEKEKEQEKINKCRQRALGYFKKISGRKLMPKSEQVKEQIPITEEPNVAAVEDDPFADFFSED
ncbi:cilia- and flagella-associated protein 100-like isoform X2 [Melanotaenia boesemani]|uniref:cilia- and flagella-associated protein 100-like isoform X2 n=1 Tax=Melanotaenia boesemani TaxID=1250792 RepID=UPI001C0453B6|nr:cilia- and flagella-associated protein 100-like isoform X2 [Melanotaenia boesemani]